MPIIKIIFPVVLIALLSGCVSQISNDMNALFNQNKKQEKEIEITKIEKNIENEKISKIPEYKLLKNEIEFLEILKTDKYASLCGSEEKYLTIKNMHNSEEKSLLLKGLFYDYASNLNNSCIDQESFKIALKSSHLVCCI